MSAVRLPRGGRATTGSRLRTYVDSRPGTQRPRPCQRRSSISRWIHVHFRSTRFCFRFRLAVLFGSGSPLLARIGGKQRTLRAIDAKKCLLPCTGVEVLPCTGVEVLHCTGVEVLPSTGVEVLHSTTGGVLVGSPC